MKRICLFPGTFDPITLGHTDVIDRSLDLFDEIVVGVGVNAAKTPMFPLEQRIQWIREIYSDRPKVRVISYEGLTVNTCKEIGAQFILRGIRSIGDFEYEKAIADVNRMMDENIETIFLSCSPRYSTLASSLVRDVLRYGGDASQLLPANIIRQLKA
ncbi:Phosphopantetheine adenylyltransferase [Chitinophaga sp. YR627]|jgi:pantetheine-phosphate adenylyltransferase|uniref:Phosphopantetheine adenylyltransferase n=1 Tax=Chitinophaga pinensis (strain ATCC 43595 / DSM 2588 / LMG 13176 / NBRC 15968 / NCIMB 11800 / UQM 2034) TaxID=485918 RepID=A0A979GZ38_CHIPD|nr:MULTISPECIES: pantetheine-phosphate adenylyltransferase [Chitinophaga]ACU63636.1 pantetheine-phosphate adenylyltransferase [Chitinophaga pinensis DSM 2588]SFO56651.1 Phosphopantetheine adenylyltransferase [Chitinophaga sp. YR627]